MRSEKRFNVVAQGRHQKINGYEEDNEKHVTDFIAVLGIAALTAGCLKKSSLMERIAALEKSSCACADKTCAEKAINVFLKIGADMKKEDAGFGPEDTRKLSRHTITILGCIAGKGVSPLTIQQELQKLK